MSLLLQEVAVHCHVSPVNGALWSNTRLTGVQTSRLSNASGKIAFAKWNMTWTTKKTRLYIGLLAHRNSRGVLPSSLWASSSMGFLTTLLLHVGHKKHLEVFFPVGWFINPGFTLHNASHVMFFANFSTFLRNKKKHEPPKPVNHLVFRWPKSLFFMVLGLMVYKMEQKHWQNRPLPMMSFINFGWCLFIFTFSCLWSTCRRTTAPWRCIVQTWPWC